MPQKLSGECACGAIRYECDADPIIMMNCHCRDCQKASGSGYAAIVVVPQAAVRIRGEQRYHKVIGKSGKATERGFCPECGNPLTITSERRPGVLGLQAGSLDDPSSYQPMIDVFTSSSQPWDKMEPKLPKHSHSPPV
jgi:hypothetical protein